VIEVNRKLNDREREDIKKTIENCTTEIQKRFNWNSLFVCILIITLSGYHIYLYNDSNWSLISKFLILITPIICLSMVEDFVKRKKRNRKKKVLLDEFLHLNKISLFPIKAKNVAELEEYEDEGILYLIEMEDDNCIYLWDYFSNFPESFPNDSFEVYLDDVYLNYIDNSIVCYGKKIAPLIIKGKSKWDYFSKEGFPGDFETAKESFEVMTQKIERGNDQSKS